MLKQLKATLGNKFSVSGSDTGMEITDPNVQGYSCLRNVATLKVRKGVLFLNLFSPKDQVYREYKEIKVTDLREAAKLIRENYGKNIQEAQAEKAS